MMKAKITNIKQFMNWMVCIEKIKEDSLVKFKYDNINLTLNSNYITTFNYTFKIYIDVKLKEFRIYSTFFKSGYISYIYTNKEEPTLNRLVLTGTSLY